MLESTRFSLDLPETVENFGVVILKFNIDISGTDYTNNYSVFFCPNMDIIIIMNDDTSTLTGTFTTSNNSYNNWDHYLAGTELDVTGYVTDTDARTTSIYDFSNYDLV